MEERRTIDPRVEAERIGGNRIRIVQPGDTLYAIAFANGLNVQVLADWNQLTDTSKLRVGQRIRLSAPLNYTAKKPATSTRPSQTADVRSSNRTTGAPVSAGQSDRSADNKARPVSRPSSPLGWQWPTRGRVIGTFSKANGRQGIDIAGEPGQPVLSAATGEVVYVGNGLKGYGNLVIVKHDERYLSAYAHNQEIFVLEGQRVAAGARIASLGVDRQKRNALHFQIRQDGDPIDPMAQLPRR